MSISETIKILKNINDTSSIVHMKSLMNKDLIKDFMGADSSEANKVKLYKRNETDKFSMSVISEKTISQDSVLFTKISKLIEQIVEKVYVNQCDLTAKEETLVTLSSMSLITKIEIDLEIYSSKANVTLNRSEIIEALCFDGVTSYLAQLLQEVQEAVGERAFAQIADDESLKAFEAETRKTMRMLTEQKILRLKDSIL